jgi:thioredoxin 1
MAQIFYMSAEWCGPCKVFKPVVKEVASATGANVNYVDVDQSPDLAQSMGITSVPTIIVQNNGETVFRRSGVMSKTDLVNLFQTHK